jgi:hypothetical protein
LPGGKFSDLLYVTCSVSKVLDFGPAATPKGLESLPLHKQKQAKGKFSEQLSPDAPSDNRIVQRAF